MRNTITNESLPAVLELRKRLDEFYRTTSSYDDFNREVPKSRPEWFPVRDRIGEIMRRQERCSVLEFGCGRTGFGHFLGADRERVTFEVQDITDRNRDCLDPQVNRRWHGDVRSITGSFDVIFSTYVWEHVSEPRSTLEHLYSLLAPGGSLLLFCPRYDLPGYIPPSARHYSFAKRYGISAWLSARRLWSMVTGRPDFFIHTDPALFHLPWYRDSDAIHWPSWWDLAGSLPAGFTIHSVPLEYKRPKDWVRTRLLTLRARIDKPTSV